MRTTLLLLLLVSAAGSLVPTASAHQCSGSAPDCVCPVPNDGKYHQHAGPSGACQGGPGGQQNAGAGGASQSIPGAGVAALVVVGAIVALLRRG